MASTEKKVMVIGMDESDHSTYALEWILEHFFTPFGTNPVFNLVVVHAKPPPSSAVGFAGPGIVDVLPIIDSDLKKIAAVVVEKAKEICNSKSVTNLTIEVVEGDARDVLCDAVKRHQASVLVVGNRGYGPIKRAFLGSVSDYCSHHAECNVMIVKMPKIKQ